MVAREDRYNALVVDPEVEERMRLKQAAVSVYHFNDVYLLPDLRSALERLQSQARYDVVFVSQNFSEVEITDFIKRGISCRWETTRRMFGLSRSGNESAKVAAGVMLGADGVLMEPYSVTPWSDNATGGSVKRGEHAGPRTCSHNVLIKDIIKQIDRLAAIRACNFDVSRVPEAASKCASLGTSTKIQKKSILNYD